MFELVHNWFNDIEEILTPAEYVEGGHSTSYLNIPIVFDIEVSSFTSNNGKEDEKHSLMYCYVLGINGKCVRGRTWDDFMRDLEHIMVYYQCDLKKRVVIYVHNLAYEFQFICKLFEWDNVFSIDVRKPIRAVTKQGIEFRCSYLLTGLSLAKVGENLIKYKVKKLVGDLDYSLLRTPNTPLTDTEWEYVLNDGLVVMAYIEEEIERLGNIAKLPYTKTGYVRNECRERCFKSGTGKGYYNSIKPLVLTPNTYLLSRDAFAGGFTHASILKVNKTHHNVGSYDFTSSYPAVMLAEEFPMSAPMRYTPKDYDDFLSCLRKYCCLFQIKFYGIKSKFPYESYISESHCYELEGEVKDNGRIREAKILATTITEVDYKIICEVYDFEDFEISNFYRFYKGYLPKEIILSVLDFYEKKTVLKGVEGKEQEYLVNKGMLNSLFGMAVTDIVRDDIGYSDTEGWFTKEVDIDKAIKSYNYNRNRFLFYDWSVWIPAYARFNLWTGILEFKGDYIYSDTDSIKAINYKKHQHYIDAYNRYITEKIYACLDFYEIPRERAHPCNIKGEPQQIGVWDFEGEYKTFKTLGAKRYLVEKADGSIQITISGVAKKNGADYLLWKYKTIPNIFKHFSNNLCFPASYVVEEDGKKITKSGTGKQTLTYLDEADEGNCIDYLGNEYHYQTETGIYMEGASYDLSIELQYLDLIIEEAIKYKNHKK